jgi:hypothetical protein
MATWLILLSHVFFLILTTPQRLLKKYLHSIERIHFPEESAEPAPSSSEGRDPLEETLGRKEVFYFGVLSEGSLVGDSSGK